jgi:hypothetical protein
MAGVRAMLSRVQRLERAGAPLQSPFDIAFGSTAAFCETLQSGADAGELDRRDMVGVIAALTRWDTDGVWGMWQRNRPWHASR